MSGTNERWKVLGDAGVEGRIEDVLGCHAGALGLCSDGRGVGNIHLQIGQPDGVVEQSRLQKHGDGGFLE